MIEKEYEKDFIWEKLKEVNLEKLAFFLGKEFAELKHLSERCIAQGESFGDFFNKNHGRYLELKTLIDNLLSNAFE